MADVEGDDVVDDVEDDVGDDADVWRAMDAAREAPPVSEYAALGRCLLRGSDGERLAIAVLEVESDGVVAEVRDGALVSGAGLADALADELFDELVDVIVDVLVDVLVEARGV